MYFCAKLLVMQLLLISNSTNAGEPYLAYPRENIKTFLGDKTNIIFIPYAAVGFSYDDYVAKVNDSLAKVNITVKGIHSFVDPVSAIAKADAIITGGGNTFHLVAELHKHNLIEPIRKSVLAGTPYVGWSAGSNICCPTLKTTNDMPIVEPKSFNTLNLVPFQINPHYLDANPDGHAGETREQRINEFLAVNHNITVAGLREGTMFLVDGSKMKLIGDRSCRIFNYGKTPKELNNTDDFSFLLG